MFPMSSGFGPGFQDARSKLFRLEYAAASIAIVGYLVWRSVYLGGVDWLQVIFWVVFPDLASFIPIGASSKRREWPPWGAKLYNVFHTVLIWGLAFAASWLALGVVYWPLFGWLGHITVDRAAGYTLRA
jgi:hypothetical protein